LLNQIAAIHGTGVAASTTSYESIQTVTVGSGGQSSISFSSIPSTYKHLQIRALAKTNVSSGYSQIVLNFNGDTASNYNNHQLYGFGASAGAQSAGSQPVLYNGYISANFGSTANMFGATIIDILDYTSTNKTKVTRGLSGIDMNGSGAVTFGSGLWLGTTAINSITVGNDTGSNFVQYSSFALYGIKG
jgi:hypothetical protein